MNCRLIAAGHVDRHKRPIDVNGHLGRVKRSMDGLLHGVRIVLTDVVEHHRATPSFHLECRCVSDCAGDISSELNHRGNDQHTMSPVPGWVTAISPAVPSPTSSETAR